MQSSRYRRRCSYREGHGTGGYLVSCLSPASKSLARCPASLALALLKAIALMEGMPYWMGHGGFDTAFGKIKRFDTTC